MLVPVDFTEGSEQVLLWAAEFAEDIGAHLDVLHVIPHPHQLDPFFRPGLPPARTVELIRSRAQERLEALVGRRKLRPRLHVLEGEPATGILEQIAALKPDLVVVGTRSRGGVLRFFLGSVAEKVIRAAQVPVITVRCRPRK